jgi:hypothetical protein
VVGAQHDRAHLFCFFHQRRARRKTPHHQHSFRRKSRNQRRTVGTTPFEKDYPGGYFHKAKTTVGSRLGRPLVVRSSFDGYSIKEIVLTEGLAEWISLEGRNYGNYFLFKTNHSDVRLDSIIATFTGGIAAHPPANFVARLRIARSSVSKTQEMSAGRDIPPGTVRFEGTAGGEIYVDGNSVGHIPSAIPLPEGRYEILISYGKSAHRQKHLTALPGSRQTFHVEFPIAQ